MPKRWESFSDYYREELFPYAIEYGMTAKEFWEDDPALFWSYRISYINRKKNEQFMQNQIAWLQGAYFYDAICKALANAFSKGKKCTYMEKPFELDKQAEPKEIVRDKAKNSNLYWASFKDRLLNARK